MIGVVVSIVVLSVLGLLYGLARHRLRARSGPVPPHHLPPELQQQELERQAFAHRVRTRATLDAALHQIRRAAEEHRGER